ncbi:MAG TPA: membrane protein insertase YidC, partial [Pyrinomonadaceae bacterium]|nr:membrane protein insertase YidC [Pyrinomonadaceae bacterium]
MLSSAILFLWSYFYTPVAPPKNGHPAASPSPTATATTDASQAANQNPAPATPLPVANVTNAPKRTITITTPLYVTKFETLGAEPVSWVITANKNGQTPIYSVAGKKSDKKPLELISAEGVNRQPRLVPLQLQTGDTALDDVLRAATYRVEGLDQAEGDASVDLTHGQKKELAFVYEDSNQIQVRKTILFDADHYETDLKVQIQRGGQPVPQVKVAIGPSIGDQGVGYHTFYSVAPEAVSYVGDKLERHIATSINGNSSSPDKLVLNGPIDWAGVADTYFAMVAVPPQKTTGLEYRTTAYEHKHEGSAPEKRFLITAFVPIPSDGTRT